MHLHLIFHCYWSSKSFCWVACKLPYLEQCTGIINGSIEQVQVNVGLDASWNHWRLSCYKQMDGIASIIKCYNEANTTWSCSCLQCNHNKHLITHPIGLFSHPRHLLVFNTILAKPLKGMTSNLMDTLIMRLIHTYIYLHTYIHIYTYIFDEILMSGLCITISTCQITVKSYTFPTLCNAIQKHDWTFWKCIHLIFYLPSIPTYCSYHSALTNTRGCWLSIGGVTDQVDNVQWPLILRKLTRD